MLIGKIWDDANQRDYWGQGQDFDDLLENLRGLVSDYGGNDEFDPAKVEV